MLFRRQHKKGISEVSADLVEALRRSGNRYALPLSGLLIGIARYQEVVKKRSRRTVKHQRAIVGASLDVIKERRTQRPEARAAARQLAIKEGKEKKSAAESKKKAEKAKNAGAASKGQVQRLMSKQGAKGGAMKGGKNVR